MGTRRRAGRNYRPGAYDFDEAEERAFLHARPAEQLLMDALPEGDVRSVLCTSQGRAQLGAAAAEAYPDAQVVCHFLDVFQTGLSRRAVAELNPNLEIVCEPDFPPGPFELVALPVSKTGEAELTRELLQEGLDRVVEGGWLLCATDNRRDTWLHDELRKLADKVTRDPQDRGIVYRIRKTGPLRKKKSFECRFAFRDEGRLIHVVSRPGVFSHRRLDLGSRALIESMKVGHGMRVLDVGCGSGVVSLAAALRAEDVHVHAVDSHVRAVQCTRLGAEANGTTRICAELDDAVRTPEAGTFDLVLANPPYFSNFRIAEIFLAGAVRALRPTGRVLFVTKQSDWFAEHLAERFAQVDVDKVREYSVVTGSGGPAAALPPGRVRDRDRRAQRD